MKQPLTTDVLEQKPGRSMYTIRDMLKKGELPGWELRVPERLRKAAGKKVCECWYVDEVRFQDYQRKAMAETMSRHIGRSASDLDFHISARS